jgi:hypothetical protein
MSHGFSVECIECGLLIATEMEEDYDGNHMEWSLDVAADCCKTCENMKLESCKGICEPCDNEPSERDKRLKRIILGIRIDCLEQELSVYKKELSVLQDLFKGPVARLYEVEPEDLLPGEE